MTVVVIAARSSDRRQLQLFVVATVEAVVSGRRRRTGVVLFEQLRLEAPHAAA